MTKLIKSTEVSELMHTVDFLVESTEYTVFKNRIVEQVLANIEVKGYRKGKAPREKAMEQVDPVKLDQTILTEVLQKYSDEAVKLAAENLKDKKLSSFQLDVNPEFTKETKDGFNFRLVAHLLPNIDLSDLKKLKIKEPTVKEIEDRPSYKDFEKSEIAKITEKYAEYKDVKKPYKEGDKLEISMTGKVDGVEDSKLKADNFVTTLGQKQFIPGFEESVMEIPVGKENTFKVTFPEEYFEASLANKEVEFTVKVNKASRQKSAKIKDVIEANEELKKAFPSEVELKDYIKNFYDNQTTQILKEIKQKNLIQAIVDETKDFALPDDKINAEIERIYNVFKSESDSKKVDIGEVFATSGLPGSEVKDVKKLTDKKVKTNIADYVKKEFKLSALLSYIYSELPAEEKIHEEELNQFVEQAKKNKGQFNLPADASEEEVKNVLSDRMVRQSAVNWLYEQFGLVEKHEHTHEHVHDENCDHDHN